jgi:hypothetical protein
MCRSGGSRLASPDGFDAHPLKTAKGSWGNLIRIWDKAQFDLGGLNAALKRRSFTLVQTTGNANEPVEMQAVENVERG